MDKNLLSAKEAIVLLGELLNEENAEREAIAAIVHSATSGFSLSKLWLGNLTRKRADNGRAIAKLTESVDENIETLKHILDLTYPRLVINVGIHEVLQAHVAELNNNYNLGFEFIDAIKDKTVARFKQQVNIFKLCKLMLEYQRLRGVDKLRIELRDKRKELVLTLVAEKPLHNRPVDALKDKKLRLIKAYLLWTEAKIYKSTNWQNKLHFGFPLG